ncbi:MAG: DsrE family protein [Planctomycetaceae bacterium]|nr:DsrE family protein [Planctomycetaceae bacterium]
MSEEKTLTVILTVGKSDNGKMATLAFSAALSAAAMGQPASIFLTGDGAVWGFEGSARGISVQGFPPLDDLIQEFRLAGGRLLLCSVCHRTCSSGSHEVAPSVKMLDGTEICGFATVLELAGQGVCLTM